MQHKDIGEPLPLDASFSNAAGAAADPTTVGLVVEVPDGTTITIPPEATPYASFDHTGGVGEFTYRGINPATVAGVYVYTYTGAGGGVDVTETEYVAVGLVERLGPCEPWMTWDQVVAEAAPKVISTLDASQREMILDFATFLLYGMTNVRYPGLCHGTFGVCAACHGCGASRGMPSTDAWGNLGWYGGCCCGPYEVADLSDTGYPAVAALRVTIEGADLARSSWRIDDRRWLVRLDGGTWPSCANLTTPSAFQIELVYGRVPPWGGDWAAAALAAEMAKGTVGGDCVLPAEVVQVVREGITYRTVDAKELFKDGLSGVARTDRWLAAEVASRKPGPGWSDPAGPSPSLSRLGTDTGMDR